MRGSVPLPPMNRKLRQLRRIRHGSCGVPFIDDGNGIGPVLALTTPPSWNTITGGWPNAFCKALASSSRLAVLEV